MRTLRSLIYLAYYFNRHWIRLIWRRFKGPRRELPIFREQYDADGLSRFTPEDRSLLDGLSRCLACGWCETGQPASQQAPNAMPSSPSLLATTLTRDVSDFPHLGGWTKTYADSAQPEELCPFGVPLAEGAKFLARYAGE